VLVGCKRNVSENLENFESYNCDDCYNIWMYWENLNNKKKAPFLDLCFETVKYHCNKKFKINLLNEVSIHDFLKDLRPELDDLLTIQQKVDYYRYRLLYEYGGIWIDADIIILKDLSALIGKLKNYDFVGFGCHYKDKKKCLQSGYPYPANWVMASRKGGKLMLRCSEGCDDEISKGENLMKKYHILGRELVWKNIKFLLKNDKSWSYYHYGSKCVERDSNNKKFYNHRTISNEEIDEECKDKFLFFPIYNSAPGFPLWFTKMSKEELIKKDLLISKLFRKSLGYNMNKNKRKDKLFNKYYIINLTETKEGRRRLKVLKNHDYLKDKISIIKGVYGRNVDKRKIQDKVKLSWDYGSWLKKKSKMVKMSDGEIGVALSHYKIWKNVIDQKDDMVMVLEDDAIDFASDFDEKMDIIMKEVPNDWDIILIGFYLNQGNDSYRINDYIYRVNNFVLLHCYVINEKGCKKLLDSMPIDSPVDTWISSISNKVNIYRHNFLRNRWSNKPSSRLVRQRNDQKQIINTNNVPKGKGLMIDSIRTIMI